MRKIFNFGIICYSNKTMVMRDVLRFCIGIFLMCLCLGASAQVKITTSHKDFKIQVLRCAVQGSNCYVDMLFENVGTEDLNVSAKIDALKGYDDAGNQYKWDNNANGVFLYVANMNYAIPSYNSNMVFPSEVPVKVRMELTNISEIATQIRKLEFHYLGPNDYLDNRVVKISDIPISR